ncbi:kinase-like domain-containing protein [Tanacetum coccineum]
MGNGTSSHYLRLIRSSNDLSDTWDGFLGECISLTILNLSGNIFQGIIPSSLSSLGGLEVLDISQNNLSGEIPQFLDKWVSLELLNLSFNDFEGEVPVVGVFANASAFSVLENNRLCGGLVTLELPKCKEKGSKKKRFPLFVLAVLIALVLLVVLCCVHLLCKKKRDSQPSQSLGNERFLRVSYNELFKATDGFYAANLIGERERGRGEGEGGFSSVYKGVLGSNDDKSVAVKVLHLRNRGAEKSFLAECEAWRNIRHRHLLKIITSCSSTDFQGNDFKALVYEYMSNGSVHDWLHSSANTSKLNLLQRVNILRDVANALDYLHNRCQTTIVHGDLNPSNILLDDDMVAHVGDFGLARLLGADLNENSSTGVKGTIGYAPPEYGIRREMASSGDIYSFGILLLEVMTGKKPTDGIFNEGLSLHKFAYMALLDHVIDIIDDNAIVLQSTEANAKKVEECMTATVKIGVSCSVDSPPQRMKIEMVVTELQRILNNGTVDDVKKIVAILDAGDIPSTDVVEVVGGAFTGEVSAEMLANLGVPWVILGHSERRALLSETNEFVGDRVAYALSQGLKVIACVGETLEQREAGTTMEAVAAQTQAIAGIAFKTFITYFHHYVVVHAGLRKWFAEKVSAVVSASTRIIYGAVEVETAKHTWDQLAGPSQSTCAQVIHARPDKVNTIEHNAGEDDNMDGIAMGKDLEIGVPRNSDKVIELNTNEVAEPETANNVMIAKTNGGY